MTRKDFVAIAEAVKDSREALIASAMPTDSPMRRRTAQVFDSLSRTLADTCSKTNPRFNRSKFLAACGVEGY